MDIENNDTIPADAPGDGADINAGAATPTFSAGETVSSVSLLSAALQAPTSGDIKLNRDGTIRRKPGRKPGQVNGTGKAAATTVTPKTPAQIKAQQITSGETAKMLINSSVGALVTFIGPEWDFESQQEADTMKTVVTAYIDAKGGASMSPEAVLLLAVSGYALPRTQHQNTRDKISAFFKGTMRAILGVFRR